MKLLYLMTEPFGIGGVQSDLLVLSEDLSKRGHEVHVATTSGVLLDELKSKGARHVNINFYWNSVRALVRGVIALRRAVRDNAIELVAPQSIRSTIAAWVALRLWPCRVTIQGRRMLLPIVTTIHNVHNPRHFAYAGHLLRVAANFVIFESNYERDRLLASGLPADRSCVIHSGIDTDRFVARMPDPALLARYGWTVPGLVIFGIVARLSEEKGHGYLIDAFARVHRAAPHARLMIVGDGPLLEPVRARVASLDLQDTVVFAGMQRDVPSFLSIMDVFVLASTRESFPLAAREAMAAGRPVIAPRIGGCPEVVDHERTGLLFESADVAALAQCMLRLLDAPTRQRMGVESRERVERLFSRRSWVAGDERIYLRAAAGMPGTSLEAASS